MLTAAQVRQYLQADIDLDAVTVDRVLALVKSLNPSRPQAFIDGVFEGILLLVPDLFDVSALLGSDKYETARDQSRARGRFAVDLANPLSTDQVVGSARWALGPFFGGMDGADDMVADRLSGSATRMVREGGRRTVTENAARDPAKPRFARVLSGGGKHCDFCQSMASRGAVYASSESAGALSDWHDRCGCSVEPSW